MRGGTPPSSPDVHLIQSKVKGYRTGYSHQRSQTETQLHGETARPGATLYPFCHAKVACWFVDDCWLSSFSTLSINCKLSNKQTSWFLNQPESSSITGSHSLFTADRERSPRWLGSKSPQSWGSSSCITGPTMSMSLVITMMGNR